MKRSLMKKLTVAGSTAVLAFGAVACDVEEGAGDGGGVEDPVLDEGGDTGGEL